MKIRSHNLANVFPLMNPKEFEELKEDIKQNGLLEPIVLFEGKILDGRNRYNACKEADIKLRTKEYKGKDALQYIISTNLKRRHLNDNQRSVVAENISRLMSLSIPKVSKLMNVQERQIDRVREIRKKKPEEIIHIESGKKKVGVVIRNIKLEEQRKEIEKLKEVKGEYDVIVIDPPWSYEEKYDPDGRRGACPYPTMDASEIKNIKIPAKKDCVVWLWTTHRFLWRAKEILDNWGFEYKAVLVWDKVKMGLGMRFRMQCEFCLVGIKGKPYWKLTNQRDIIREARTTHSTKPKAFYKLVEETCAGRKLDYFAREKRNGWDVYGDEVK